MLLFDLSLSFLKCVIFFVDILGFIKKILKFFWHMFYKQLNLLAIFSNKKLVFSFNT